MYTKEFITELPAGSVFVYGSNQYSMHGSGSAKTAVGKFGAMYGDAPMGLLNQSYGIITKSFNNIPVSIEFIRNQVKVLYDFAILRPDLTFHVTKIGTERAGFKLEEIASIFKAFDKPVNIILPKEFSNE